MVTIEGINFILLCYLIWRVGRVEDLIRNR